ncbi:hypothetical protein BCR36DRAFT_374526 [Piromyces finnis]|uniref:Uncharacterized protein n=1 Tax=Piromyces finnis TaxID=1754191 RepID=A0A1Y1UWL2_9FUNG|nr:hypothetical protein BCR36DRAFT_374526 [Piromyces finnis]|eukprot:ORX42375.1 hypothetical protein BCR36DRAFT_374526 [Piromyces finnis]
MTQAGIPGFTCGSLFKFWGQVSGDTESSTITDGTVVQPSNKVCTLSGRLMIKTFYEQKHYRIDPKTKYTLVKHYQRWTPTDEETLQVVTDTHIVDPNDDPWSETQIGD